MSTLFVHIHIVKCGGTTFEGIMRRNFEKGFYFDRALFFYQYTAEQFTKLVQNCPWLKAYSSHKVSLDLPFELDEPRIQAIAFVRDPVDRFLSHYFMHSHAKENSIQSVPEARGMTVDQYVRYGLVEGNQPGYINGQLKFLTGGDGPESIVQVREAISAGKLLLFPLSRFDEACIVLERLHGESFKDCSYGQRVNVSTRDETVSEATLSTVQEHVGSGDRELLRMAETALDQILREQFPAPQATEEALTAFRARCQARPKGRGAKRGILQRVLRQLGS